MIWFSADFHFDHFNIIKLCNRPFKDIDGMNLKLIDNFNSVVGKKDDVYILGDVSLRKPQIAYSMHLNGTKHFLQGNHDVSRNLPYIKIINPPGLLDEYGKQISITLCHFAMRSWDKSHYGSWHLFGHHHGRLEPYGMSFDVGVDCNNYFPINLEQVKEKMKELKPIVDFRKQE